MIRITRQADYSVALLTRMATETAGETFSARDLAESLSLPQPMVSKILKQLARAKLLTSHRGVKGGYSLDREPKAISVGEIIAAVDGPIALTDCLSGQSGSCDQETICSVRGNWHHINQAVRVALNNVSLLQMTEPFTGPLSGPLIGPFTGPFTGPAFSSPGELSSENLAPVPTSVDPVFEPSHPHPD